MKKSADGRYSLFWLRWFGGWVVRVYDDVPALGDWHSESCRDYAETLATFTYYTSQQRAA